MSNNCLLKNVNGVNVSGVLIIQALNSTSMNASMTKPKNMILSCINVDQQDLAKMLIFRFFCYFICH